MNRKIKISFKTIRVSIDKEEEGEEDILYIDYKYAEDILSLFNIKYGELSKVYGSSILNKAAYYYLESKNKDLFIIGDKTFLDDTSRTLDGNNKFLYLIVLPPFIDSSDCVNINNHTINLEFKDIRFYDQFGTINRIVDLEIELICGGENKLILDEFIKIKTSLLDNEEIDEETEELDKRRREIDGIRDILNL